MVKKFELTLMIDLFYLYVKLEISFSTILLFYFICCLLSIRYITMNLHHLRIFYYTAKYGSITKAANVLGLTQPAVSLQLHDFQNRYNFKLLDIKEKKTYLTPLGKEIFERSSAIFDVENQIDLLISDYQNLKDGLITIFSTSSFSYYYLPAVIAGFKGKLPNIILHSYTYCTKEIIEKTANFINDIGFTGYKIEHPKLVTKELLRESLYVICHPDHRLSKKRIIMPHDLESHNFILTEKGGGSRRSIDKYIEENNIKLNVVAEIDSPISIIEMVKQNLGISIVSKYIIAEAVKKKEIMGIPISGGCFRYFYLVYHKEKHMSDMIKAFIDETETWCNNYNTQILKEITMLH